MSEVPASGYDFATWTPRFIGWVLDFIVVALLWFAMTCVTDLVLWPVQHHFHDSSGLSISLGSPQGFAGMLFTFLYWVILVKIDGLTIGMANASARVRVEDATTGTTPGWQQSVIRYLFLGVVLALFSFSLGVWGDIIGLGIFMADYFVWPSFDKKRRTLHDVVARTVVRQLPKEWAKDNSMSHSPGRCLAFRWGAVLLVAMIAVGSISSWSQRQASLNSPWGVAQALAKSAEETAVSQDRAVTTHDLNDPLTIHAFASYSATSLPRGLYLIVVGHQRACIQLSGQKDVAPLVEACPPGLRIPS
jgi:uncharacterized RDD family membrane protein YckC